MTTAFTSLSAVEAHRKEFRRALAQATPTDGHLPAREMVDRVAALIDSKPKRSVLQAIVISEPELDVFGLRMVAHHKNSREATVNAMELLAFHAMVNDREDECRKWWTATAGPTGECSELAALMLAGLNMLDWEKYRASTERAVVSATKFFMDYVGATSEADM